MTEIRVTLADDHPIVVTGIKALLANAPDLQLVGEAASGSQALEIICATEPDVAIIDMSLPDLNGLELARRIAEKCPKVKMLALTVHESRAYVQPMLQAGARGYLLKRSAADELLRAIRAVAAGGLYLDPAVADKALTDARAGRDQAEVGGGDLSPRETDVLRLTAQGFSNKEIALRLDISVKTVETYKARAAEKLGLRTRADIVRFGAARGWLDPLSETPP
ncbi:MAG: response regulator transcription factor [Methylobacterium sp.]|uniref:response regulator n=1 Tax=Methylobacterium sp. TaxID=409 RepID=UPI00258D2695|nr:response regulator transcription factor [Methylobacterium sp.]MBY0299754.1 response regulator transcription factor [Methylobacterium sp.]